MAYTFVVNDENEVNTYGFRVLTSGIKLKTYRSNPLVLWMHKRPHEWNSENNKDNEVFPIGTCSKVWSEDGILKANIDFDEKDEFANRIKAKVDAGIIRMCSMGFDVVSRSEDPNYLLPGQTRPTVTQSELFEISVVDIGANRNALRLFNSQQHEVSVDEILPKLKLSNEHNSKSMKKLIAKLNGFGLDIAEDANEYQVVAALDGFKKPNAEKPTEKLVNQLIALGKKTGVVTEGETGNETKFRKLAAADMELFVDMLGIEKLGTEKPQTPAPRGERMSDLVAQAKQKQAKPAADEKDFEWYEKNEPQALARMEATEPEKFAKLKAADDAKYQ